MLSSEFKNKARDELMTTRVYSNIALQEAIYETLRRLGLTTMGRAVELGDDGANDLLVSEVLRTNELQVWSLSEHLVDVPLIRAKPASHGSA